MTARIFLDTNILVYAHDRDAGEKHQIAKEAVLELWESRSGVLSTQVLQEFYITLTRKITPSLKKTEARKILKNYFHWELVINDAGTILQAIEIEESYSVSFWDALIVSAAFSKNAATILTEDLQHGQRVEGILIHNPFLKGPLPA